MSDQATEQDPVAMDYAEVLRRIPHRFPFLMVDRAEAFVSNTSIVGIKNVTANEPYFQGHFPADPVMPGVLIIESMAQTGALLMSKTLNVDATNKIIMFMSVDGARFRRPVRPGDTLRMPVRVTRQRGDIFKFKGEAFVGSTMAAECEFAAMVVELPK